MESKYFESPQDASSVPLTFLESPQDAAPLPSNFLDSQQDAAPVPSNFLESPQDAAPLPSDLESPQDAAPLPSNFLLSRQDASPSPSNFLKRPQDASTSTLNFLKSPQDSSPSLGPPVYKEHPSPEPGYAVQKFDDKDDAGSIPAWKNRLNQLLPFTAVFTICTYWLYVSLRVMYTIAAQRVGHTIYPVAWIFLGIEFGVALPLLFLQVLYCFAVKTRRRPRLRLIGENVPTVDVLITCAGEELAVILDTVRAAAGIDWPQDRFRVVVLDDKSSEDVQREVQLLALEHSCIHYTARRKIKGVPHHFKAGNLNHGLSYVDSLGKSEYVAALDADMIVERSWLRAMLAHLLADPELALACPPQLFYNVPKNDPLDQNLAFFFHILEGVKDSIASAWCTGSGYAVRRDALDQIGGFPTGSLAEDVFCSNLLLGAGWKTCYVHEPLQYGMVPDSFSGHIKQRARWTIGTIQSSARLNFFLYGRVCRGMSFLHRFCGFCFTFATLSTVPSTASLLLFPIVLASGFRLVAYSDVAQLRWLIRAAFLTLLGSRVNEWIAFLPAGYRFAWRGNTSTLWMAPYHAVAIVRSFLLPHWLGGKLATFSSSGSINSVINERDVGARAPLMRRIKVIWWNCGVFIHVIYLLFIIGAASSSIIRAIFVATGGWRDRLFYVLTHTAWPPMVWLITMAACTIPIHYSVRPPSMPDREDLLQRDKETGIAHPTKGAKQPRWGKSNLLEEFFYGLVAAYTITLFVGTWFF